VCIVWHFCGFGYNRNSYLATPLSGVSTCTCMRVLAARFSVASSASAAPSGTIHHEAPAPMAAQLAVFANICDWGHGINALDTRAMTTH